MIKFIFSTLFICLFCLFYPTIVVAKYNPTEIKNNIYGISIINHSDLNDAARLVNSNGGDWGYVTIVITEDQRNRDVWQKFLDDCRRLHLVPIIRIATKYENGSWSIPNNDSIDTWINFFNSLNWTVENRYIVIGNEPNHSKEWGGKLNPAAYAQYLKTFSERLHNSSSDYFVLNAGFDQDAPNSKVTMDQMKYMKEMVSAVPDIFHFIDGWNSHSYPNPAFSGSVTSSGRRTVRGYEWELEMLRSLGTTKELPVFITETGWIRSKKNNDQDVGLNLKHAFQEIWDKDKRIIAVTPFILNYAQDPFFEFSWKNKDGVFFPIYEIIKDLHKESGTPRQKISGDIIFSFLNPLIFRNSEQKGFVLLKNTGQAIWIQSESNVINDLNNEIKISNTKFTPIEPFSTGLVVYTLNTPDAIRSNPIKLGFYVRGERVGDVTQGKIISF